ncbi:MAG: phosphoadenylyl-sulfate reductase [Acidobacteriota bacterium]
MSMSWLLSRPTDGELTGLSSELATYPLDELLTWSVETFGDGLCLATSFGPQSIVLAHALSEVAPQVTIFYLETDLLFPETLGVKAALEHRLQRDFTRVHGGLSLDEQDDEHGPRLWERDPDACCGLRKVEPLARFLAGRPAWMTGLRRSRVSTRSRVDVVEWDRRHGLIKLNPVARWSDERVQDYLLAHDLPVNPLLAEGYTSVGCRPCTSKPTAGDPRSGRWAGTGKTECGIHVAPEERS